MLLRLRRHGASRRPGPAALPLNELVKRSRGLRPGDMAVAIRLHILLNEVAAAPRALRQVGIYADRSWRNDGVVGGVNGEHRLGQNAIGRVPGLEVIERCV